jgi:HD-GYP domain-containing protein (c-di-GMP phosphodiesterase class II)
MNKREHIPKLQPSDYAEVERLLRPRAETLGAILLRCDLEGNIFRQVEGKPRWLEDLLLAGSMTRTGLHEACRLWRDEGELRERELLPGLWAAPLPIMRRKRRVGFFVGLIATADLLDGEHLVTLCNAAGADLPFVRDRLQQRVLPVREEMLRRALALRWMCEDLQTLADQESDSAGISCELSEAYEELTFLYQLGRSMRIEETPSDFINLTCRSLLDNLPYRFVAVRLIGGLGRSAQPIQELHLAGEPQCSREEVSQLTGRLVESLTSRSFQMLLPERQDAYRYLSPLGRLIMVHPLQVDGKLVGAILAADKVTDDPDATTGEIKLVETSAGFLMIFLENASLYQDQQALFLGTLEALTASIDAKDAYTCGHSQRVAMLSRDIAKAAGFDAETVERIHIAGVVHDVGKIGVREAVLCKCGRLTREEFEEIKKHPEIGARILRDVPQLQDVIPGVLYHHERIDGRGYPHGLSGYDIPVFARVIALADSFDAMSSTRTYRAALSREEVLKEIRACSGTQFDPALVPYLLDMDLSGYDEAVRRHRAAGPSIVAAESMEGRAA